MNPNHRIHRDQFRKAIEHHRLQLTSFRRNRVEVLKAYAGSTYGEGKQLQTVVALLLSTATSWLATSAANLPYVMVESPYQKYKPFARHFGVNMNALLRQIRFLDTLHSLLLDAFFGNAFCKISPADSPTVVQEEDIWAVPGSPYASRISLDNWVHDTSVDDLRRVQFAGDSYRIPFDMLKDSDLYDQKVVAKLHPDSKYQRPMDEQAKYFSGEECDGDEYYPMVSLASFWMPREKKICIWPCDRDMVIDDCDPVCVIDAADGAETGPYRTLNLGPVPDNIMASSPGMNLLNLHNMVNSSWRKQNNQAKMQRNITVYEPGAKEDADAIRTAKEGEFVKVKTLSAVSPFATAGVSQATMLHGQTVLNAYDRQAGRGSQAGLAQQADTATQEAYIRSAIGAVDGYLNTKVQNFIIDVVTDLGRLLWKDELTTLAASIDIPQLKTSVPSRWNVDREREGDFLDYNFTISPFSMPYRSPEQKAQLLKSLVTEVSQTLMMLSQTGGDGPAFVEYMADYHNLPELKHIFPFDAPAEALQPPEASVGGAFNPNKPNGNYTRKNVSSGQDPSNSNGFMGALTRGGTEQTGLVGVG